MSERRRAGIAGDGDRPDHDPGRIMIESEWGWKRAEMERELGRYAASGLLDVEFLEAGAVEVYCWRMEEFLRAGYSDVLADALASNPRVDLHHACDLLARGCDEQTAFRILA